MSDYLKKRKVEARKASAVPFKDVGSTDREKPIFSFHSLQKDYCVTDCEQNEKASLAECLRKLSNFCWMQLKNDKRHGLGCEKIARNAIKAPMPTSISEDTTFLAFRFHGKAPMVGYREQAIFHILWLDRKYTLYDHG